MSSLAALLKSKLDEGSLNIAAAAEAIGVGQPRLRAVLAGKSVPNARSIDKYATFLGITLDEAKTLIAAGKSAAPKATRKGRKAGKAAKEAKEAAPAKRAGRPARAAKGGDAAAALATISAALKDAAALSNDALAIAVHKLSASQRKLVEGVLKAIG